MSQNLAGKTFDNLKSGYIRLLMVTQNHSNNSLIQSHKPSYQTALNYFLALTEYMNKCSLLHWGVSKFTSTPVNNNSAISTL